MQIAILGSAPSSLHLAPMGDPSWKIWACSPGTYSMLSRCDAFFELHRWEPGEIGKPATQKQWFSPEYVAWMGLRDPVACPVWMHEPVTEIPASRALPIDDIKAKFGTYFLTSSISIMIACAIDDILNARKNGDDGEHSIALFGVDMAACLAASTKVLTADLQYVELGSVKVGDKLIAFDEQPRGGDGGNYRDWRSATVLQTDKLMLPCYEVEMEDGTNFIASENHLWLTYAEHEKRWKKTSELVTPAHRADRPTKIVKPLAMWQQETSWDAGYLAAAVDGEGHLDQSQRVGGSAIALGLAQRDNAMLSTVHSAMESMGFAMIEAARDGTDNTCIKYTVAGGRSKLMEFLGRTRSRRLLQKFNPEMLGVMHAPNAVAVKAVKFIGDYPVIGIKTDTKTFIAEGYASHNSEEYGYQRAGCQHFLELAANLNIHIVVPPESDLLRPMPVYGICESSHWMIKNTARQRELQGRLAQANAQMQTARDSVQFLTGALDDLNYQMLTWGEDREGTGTSFGILASSPFVRNEIIASMPKPEGPKAATSPTCLGEMAPVPQPKPRAKAAKKRKR